MAVWSTEHGPGGVIHNTLTDAYVQPLGPACGVSSDGLWLSSPIDFDDVPAAARCPDCVGRAATQPAG